MIAKVLSGMVLIDNTEALNRAIKGYNNFTIEAYDGSEDDEKTVGFFLTSTNPEDECTIMFDLTKQNALFFAKAIIAISESM